MRPLGGHHTCIHRNLMVVADRQIWRAGRKTGLCCLRAALCHCRNCCPCRGLITGRGNVKSSTRKRADRSILFLEHRFAFGLDRRQENDDQHGKGDQQQDGADRPGDEGRRITTRQDHRPPQVFLQ